MSINSLRAAVTAAGGTPTQNSHVGLYRELVTALGGAPTMYAITDLIKQAITAKGGTPTQTAYVGLLRQLITQLGGTPGGYDPDKLETELVAQTFETLGPEMNADIGFDTPAYWNFISGGWSVTGSKAVNSGTTGTIDHIAFFDGAGKHYRYTFTVSGYVGGNVRAFVGSTPVYGANVAANGTFTGIIIAINGSEFGLNTADNFQGSVDDFSLKEIL